jgi:hypothetical protein
MWGRKHRDAEPEIGSEPQLRLRDALRKARVDHAERTGVVVGLHDAEVARLELLNEALDPLFKDIPDNVEQFDRGISKGDVPRLWIDVIAHVEMGRDKRQYRFVQDTRYGRAVLAESYDVPDMVHMITRYVARRMVERERALAADGPQGIRDVREEALAELRRRRRRALGAFLLGAIAGVAALVSAAMLFGPGG